MKSVMVKGLAPVDSECPHLTSHHVYCEGKVVWDVMLNQINIQNNNKYYLIQLLEADSTKSFCVWMRWDQLDHLRAGCGEGQGCLREEVYR
jgi:poly [ADP-ribose] polymerase